jgi:hypothetical protein
MAMFSNECPNKSKTLKERLASVMCNKKGGILLWAEGLASIRSAIITDSITTREIKVNNL